MLLGNISEIIASNSNGELDQFPVTSLNPQHYMAGMSNLTVSIDAYQMVAYSEEGHYSHDSKCMQKYDFTVSSNIHTHFTVTNRSRFLFKLYPPSFGIVIFVLFNRVSEIKRSSNYYTQKVVDILNKKCTKLASYTMQIYGIMIAIRFLRFKKSMYKSYVEKERTDKSY